MALSILQAVTSAVTTASEPSTISTTIETEAVVMEDVDPQFDVGNVGSTILSFGDGFSDGSALFWYGVIAGIQSTAPLIIYMITQGAPPATTGTTTTTQAGSITYPGWLPIKTLTYVLMGVWTPTFLTWMAVVFFDSMAMRELMHQALHISMAGPYFLYWVGLGDYIMNADRSPTWYVVFGVVGLWSIASIAYQAIFVPKVTRWLQETPLKDYPDPSILSGPEEVLNEAEITYVDPNPNVVKP
jgi:hypothetical protein